MYIYRLFFLMLLYIHNYVVFTGILILIIILIIRTIHSYKLQFFTQKNVSKGTADNVIKNL
jgi:hypothetical protein